jgi:hypothetical protein
MKFYNETKIYFIYVSATQMIGDIFICLNIIDVNDQNLHVTLKALKTHEWWFRLFITIFAICVVDAYYTYCHDWIRIHLGDENGMIFVLNIFKCLAYQLINFVSSGETGPCRASIFTQNP